MFIGRFVNYKVELVWEGLFLNLLKIYLVVCSCFFELSFGILNVFVNI